MNLAELTQYAQTNDPGLIPRLKNFLGRADIEVTKGAQRVGVVCENFKVLTFEQAYRLIDPDAFQEEFEETQAYKAPIKLLNYLRIILSLAPLILTWFALFAAANGYQTDLIKHPDDRTEAFLQLWQEGFHHTTSFTFSLTAIIDVALLFLLLTSSIVILALEYRARQASRQFAEDLRGVTEGLLQAVNSEGVSPVTSQADIDKIVKAVRVALGSVFITTEETIKKALDVVLIANNRVEQLFTNQVQPLFTKFEQNVSTFHLDVNKLTQEVTTIAAANTTLAANSMKMAGSAADMAAHATDLHSTMQKVDQHVVDLSRTEGEMVTKIEASQQKVVTEMSKVTSSMHTAATNVAGAADKMDQAAQKVEKVGNTLATINPQTVKQMNDDATIFTRQVSATAQQLQATIDALKKLSGQSGPRTTKRLFGLFPRP